jgi:hypothetical protein
MPGPGVAGEYLGVLNGVTGIGVSWLIQGDMGLSRGVWIGGLV